MPVRTSPYGSEPHVSATEQVKEAGYLLLCGICNQDLVPSEPTSIQCDLCKNLFHPSCLGNEGPLDSEKWFCAVCSITSDKNTPYDEEIHECPKETPDEIEVQLKEICPDCHTSVSDNDSGLECEGCFYWFHSSCQGIKEKALKRLTNTPDERWTCSACKVRETNFVTDVHWGKHHGDEAINLQLDELYKEISGWHKNNFLLPRGKAGNNFIIELTRLLNLFNMRTHLEKHAISLAILFISLMTQKPSQNSKAKVWLS